MAASPAIQALASASVLKPVISSTWPLGQMALTCHTFPTFTGWESILMLWRGSAMLGNMRPARRTGYPSHGPATFRLTRGMACPVVRPTLAGTLPFEAERLDGSPDRAERLRLLVRSSIWRSAEDQLSCMC